MNNVIYVAGASKEAGTVSMYIHKLRSYGYEISYDWTIDVLKHGTDNTVLDYEVARKAAWVDFEAIRLADYFWLLMPDIYSHGATTELGLALARQLSRLQKSRPLIMISGSWKRNIFSYLADHTFDDHDSALEAWKSETYGWENVHNKTT